MKQENIGGQNSKMNKYKSYWGTTLTKVFYQTLRKVPQSVKCSSVKLYIKIEVSEKNLRQRFYLILLRMIPLWNSWKFLKRKNGAWEITPLTTKIPQWEIFSFGSESLFWKMGIIIGSCSIESTVQYRGIHTRVSSSYTRLSAQM